MTRLYTEGAGRNQVLPIKSATAYTKGDLLEYTAGKLVPATQATEFIVAISNEDVDVANTEKVNSSVYVPTERSGQFEMVFIGTGALTIGKEFSLSDAQTVNTDDVTNPVVRLVKVLENTATDKVAVFNIRFDGQY